MSPLLRLGLNDLRLTARDKPAFFWLLVLPIAMMWFFGQAGRSGGPPRIALEVRDLDRGWLARALVDELGAEVLALREAPGTPDPERRAPRTLEIPAGFTARLLAGERQVLRLEHAPGSNEEAGLAAQAHVVRVIARTLGRLVELDGKATATPEAFRRLAERPQLVRLAVSTAGHGTPVPRGREQSVPGMLTMNVLMMTLIYGAVFLTLEKQAGMLRRQALTPLGRGRLVVGKLLGRLFLAGVQIAILLLAGRFLFGVSWGRSPLGLVLLLTSYAIAVAGLSTLLGAIVRGPAQASIVGWLVALVLAAVGGCWWPAEIMPGWMYTLAHALPTAWAMDGLHALISFGGGLGDVLVSGAVLVGFGASFSVLGARLLRFE